MIGTAQTLPTASCGKGLISMNNNCLCNHFDDKCVWLIIIVLLFLFGCYNNGCGYGCN